MKKLLVTALSAVLFAMASFAGLPTQSMVVAQDPCVSYQFMPRTIYEPQTVTAYREVMETQYQTQRTTTWKPVWTTEKRERRYSVLKPVTETSFREERYTVLKPVVETSYREETYVETTMETKTEMHDQQVVVERPVVETSYREEQVTVRKPVVETMMKSENITLYRPVTTSETRYVPGAAAVNTWGVATTPSRTQLQWLRPSYNLNPYTGQYTFQRRGLHWVQPPSTAWYVPQTSVVPTITPQTVQRTEMVPETFVKKEPVQVTRYIEETTTRKVPVETYRTERQITTRKVPVEVRTPVKRYITRRIPVETTTYQKQEMVRKVPVTRQRFETVERVEPYEVQQCRWEQVESNVAVPKVVTRRIPYQTTRMVPRTVMMRVPVDIYGRPLQVNGFYQPMTSNTNGMVSSLPVITQAPGRVIVEEPEIRIETARPGVESQARPDSSKVVFPETRFRPETDMLPVEPAPKPEDAGTTAQPNDEFIGKLNRDTSPDEGRAEENAAEEKPELNADEVENAQEANDDSGDSEETSINMPDLDAPRTPVVSPDENDIVDPVDT